MYSKWLVALLASIGLALVSSQQSTNASDIKVSTANVSPTVPTTKTSTTSPTTISTTAKPTVPPTPPTPPNPELWNGTVTQENHTCINVQFEVKIDIWYNTTNNTQWTTGFTIPNDSFVDLLNSHCSRFDNESQVITVGFKNEEYTSANLTLTFNKTDSEVRVQAVELSFNLTRALFPDFHNPSLYNTNVQVGNKDLSLFKVAGTHSYSCEAAQTADLDGQDKGLNGVKIDFLRSQVEAYMDASKKGLFDPVIDCKSSEISDVVPIAVGAALAGLVVIVLIAYFIGRRRSRRLAYQSV